jgi:LCP family protein required for cell wall assembly
MARTRRKRMDRTTQIVLIAFLFVSVVTAVLAFIWVRNQIVSIANRPLDGSGSQAGNVNQPAGNEEEQYSSVPTPNGPLQRQNDPTPVPWDGKSRITLLVMGLDLRDWEDGTDVPRTDSMILVSVDPQSGTAGMLSIPRDTWVSVPGMGKNKINTAYRWGEVYQLPGGGPALAMQTVEDFLAIPIDYYAMIDFNAFVGFIDEMGGLDMHIREEIVVDPIGPGNTRTLEPGVQTLDGATALAYARQRYTGNDDFDRSERQQEVIMAIRDQVLQFNMLPTLISKSPRLYQKLSAGIRTNLTMTQIVQLARLALDISKENIKRGVISSPLQVEQTINPEDGQAILVPNAEQIRLLRDEVFASVSNPAQPKPTAVPPQPTKTGDPAEMIKVEKARVIIKNGTATSGLASDTGRMLKELGINVVDEENAGGKFEKTTIYDFTGNPFTVRYLLETMKLSQNRVVSSSDPNAAADIVIILGKDWSVQE